MIVGTLEPLDFNAVGNFVKLQLQGKPCQGREVVKIDYPASFAANSIDAGVKALDDFLHNTLGEKLILAWSQGAQVVSRWLRNLANFPVLPAPEEVEFFVFGNPLRKYGGYIIGRPEVGGQIGLPTLNDTPYRVTDLKMQGDGWADWPGDDAGWLAKLDARKGQNKRHCYGYLTADPADPNIRVYHENTTTYAMIPAKPNLPFIPQSLIEKSFHRPEQ